MELLEKVKGLFSSQKVDDSKVILDLDSNSDSYPMSGSFFDSNTSTDFFGNFEIDNLVLKQKDKIMSYRQLSMMPDVAEALDEIINEIIFVYDDNLPLKIDINNENEKIVKAVTEKFDKILSLMNIKRNLFSVVKNSYIDGQIVIHCSYGDSGIESIKMIEPVLLYFDSGKNIFKYHKDGEITSKVYSPEEIVREDFGLYDGKISLSYLEYAIKPANILKTLEDLLVPLRFSRSISRRVFNVDIGDLPGARGAEVMNQYQGKFKYKKFYNSETGEVTNQQHITSMVEDYWFSNRSGGKGTTVDVLDETGNLGEINDILYFNKKLYRALKVPASRISNNPDADKEFTYDDTRTTKEDMKFFMFISRIRQVYSSLFKEILKREVISCKIMNDKEWNEFKNDISVKFINENKFIEKMNLDNFMAKFDIYSTAQEYQGKLFSINKILSTIFKMSDDEIKEEFLKIGKEEKDPLYSKFYQEDDGY